MLSHSADGPTADAWSALGGAPERVENVTYREVAGVLPARLPVRRMARAAVGVCSLAAAELLALRSGGPPPPVLVDEGAVATAFTSERHLRIDGRAGSSFAPLSGFWRTADGWVRTHANYPHHRARLTAALGIPGGGDAGATGDADALSRRLARELAGRTAAEVEETVYAAGGLAVAVRDSGPGAQPLVETERTDDTPVRPLLPAELPAEGVRVLDLTRVIAGPVATRTLALLGADVLRVDSPRLPEDAWAHADTGFGKRSARLDLSGPDRTVLEELLASADVVVTGYRPGALDRFGLAPEALCERRPGLVVAQLRAWERSGPWAGRRGFDSLVQARCGIASIEAGADGRPGVLPAQALDHGTGYLLAAAVLRALTDARRHGGGRLLRLSLAGTASWLIHGVGPGDAGTGTGSGEEYDPARRLAVADSAYGRLVHARPPLGYRGAPQDWSRPPGRWGTDPAVWCGPVRDRR
ncbi:CoA transferase [Actinacidiphila glaucinigra]|uniref:CoA transferase n=1 Tax=Actinacidiphila glaucinigra TaxID=235986 RepID=UPI00381DB250